MNKQYWCLIWAVLLLALAACGDDQQTAELSDGGKEPVAAAPLVESVSSVQEAVSGDLPVVPGDPGQESIPPADQPDR